MQRRSSLTPSRSPLAAYNIGGRECRYLSTATKPTENSAPQTESSNSCSARLRIDAYQGLSLAESWINFTYLRLPWTSPAVAAAFAAGIRRRNPPRRHDQSFGRKGKLAKHAVVLDAGGGLARQGEGEN